jgi:hypothetical protein
MSTNQALDSCLSLTEPVADAVGATYAYGAEQIGLAQYAPAIDHLMSDFVGGPDGGWAALCSVTFDGTDSTAAPGTGAGGNPAGTSHDTGSHASHDSNNHESHDTGSHGSHDSGASASHDGGSSSGASSSGE